MRCPEHQVGQNQSMVGLKHTNGKKTMYASFSETTTITATASHTSLINFTCGFTCFTPITTTGYILQLYRALSKVYTKLFTYIHDIQNSR